MLQKYAIYFWSQREVLKFTIQALFTVSNFHYIKSEFTKAQLSQFCTNISGVTGLFHHRLIQFKGPYFRVVPYLLNTVYEVCDKLIFCTVYYKPTTQIQETAQRLFAPSTLIAKIFQQYAARNRSSAYPVLTYF